MEITGFSNNKFYRSFRGFKDEKYLPNTHPKQYGIPGSIVLNGIPDFGDNVDQQFGESTNSAMDMAKSNVGPSLNNKVGFALLWMFSNNRFLNFETFL